MLMKTEFSVQSFDKYTNIKFHDNRYMGCELFNSDGQTEGRTEKMELILNFRNFFESAYKPYTNLVTFGISY
jgi:hypothetical protein